MGCEDPHEASNAIYYWELETLPKDLGKLAGISRTLKVTKSSKTREKLKGACAIAQVVAIVLQTQAAFAAGQMMRASPTSSTSSQNSVPSAQTNNNPPSSAPSSSQSPTGSPSNVPSTTPVTIPSETETTNPSNTMNPQDLLPQQLMQPPQSGGGTGTAGQTIPGAGVGTNPPASQFPPIVSGTIQYNAGPAPSVRNETSILQALNEALINGPHAAAIRSQLAVAKAGIAGATVSPNPILYSDQAKVSEGVRRLGPSFTIDWPWKLAFRMMAAIRTFDQAKIDLLTNLWQVRADVRRAYTELVIAVESQRTLTELYELTERLLEVSRKRFQAGDVPELDVLRAQLANSQADIDRNVGRQRIIRARQQLNLIMGRAVEGNIEVPRLPEFLGNQTQPRVQVHHGILPDFSQPVLPLSYYTDIAVKNRYELKSLVVQKVVNKWNYRNAVGQVIPDLMISVGSSEESNLPSGPNLTSNFFTVNAEIPMSNMNQGSIAQYAATKRQLNYQLAYQQNQVRSDVSSAYNNLLAARERIRVYQEHVLRESNEVARLSRRSYEVGQSDINSTLLAQQANVQIRQAYLDAVTNFQGAYTDLEQACGRPLE